MPVGLGACVIGDRRGTVRSGGAIWNRAAGFRVRLRGLDIAHEVRPNRAFVRLVLRGELGAAHAGGVIGYDGLAVDVFDERHGILQDGAGELADGDFFELADLRAHCGG